MVSGMKHVPVATIHMVVTRNTFWSDMANCITRICSFMPWLLLLSPFINGWAQTPEIPWGGWHFTSFHGLVNLEGQYRTQENILKSGFRERPVSSAVIGRFVLNTDSYILHPNFVSLDLDAEYNPSTRKDRFLVRPDQTEVSTAEKLHLQSIFFKKRPLNFTLYSDFSHQFINRDLTSNIEQVRFAFGNRLRFRNSVVPFTMNYAFENTRQKQLANKREFVTRKHSLTSNFKKSLGDYDSHDFRFSWIDYKRSFTPFDTTRNKILRLNLQDNLRFNKKGDSRLNSFIWLNRQTGDIPFKRLQANEKFLLKLPRSLRFTGNYQYVNLSQRAVTSNQNNFQFKLEHKLYRSLRSSIFAEYFHLQQTSFDETIKTGGMGVNYRKSLPVRSLLNLFYNYRLRRENRANQTIQIPIINEEHRLEDAEIVLFDNPFVLRNSVVVKDETETIIYTEGIDYLLIARGSFLEIQRVPGGLIDAGTTVLVDYTATQSVSLKFDSIHQSYGGSISLLRSLVEFYVRVNKLDFKNTANTDGQTLKTLNQQIFGSRLSFKMLSGGWEVDDSDSNILPFHSTKYYVTFSDQFLNSVLLSVTGSLKDYTLKPVNEKQRFASISSHLVYVIDRNSKVNFESAYIFQEGRGIDLDFLSFKGEWQTNFRQVGMVLGFERFSRNFSGEQIDFNGFYLKLERKF